MNQSDQEQACVFLIQGYSLHDGPGIRTTIFMKGCPLRCFWCQNPESWELGPELMTHDQKCISCGKCAEACSAGAISFSEKEERIIDRRKCNLCFDCVSACPSGALTRVGKWMTVDEIMTEIQKDELLHSRSGGGVTISGGEPLFQHAFLRRLLKACKEKGYHTALDTCGYARWEALEAVLDYVDLFLYDIKHLNPGLHKKATGKSNQRILRNLRKISQSAKIWLRVPLIPGFNDSDDNLRKVAELGREIGAERVSILPFNTYGEGKWRRIGRKYGKTKTAPPSKEKIEEIRSYIESFGLETTIGE